jgi:photosystem II stability/assembly factor-like uncharacterized protein/predicted secreted protein
LIIFAYIFKIICEPLILFGMKRFAFSRAALLPLKKNLVVGVLSSLRLPNLFSFKQNCLLFLLCLSLNKVYAQYTVGNLYETGVKIYPIWTDPNHWMSTYGGNGTSTGGTNCNQTVTLATTNNSYANEKVNVLLANKLFLTSFTGYSDLAGADPGSVNWEVFNDHHCNSRSCNTYGQCWHKGIDYQGTDGKFVYSPFKSKGKVIRISYTSESADINYVCVYYKDYDFTAFFVHLKALEVSVGDDVNMGTVIGKTGGLNHCHLEVRDGYDSYAALTDATVSDHFDPRAAFMMTNSEKLNQFMPLYVGDRATPKPVDLFIQNNAIQGAFSIADISEIQIRNKDVIKNIPVSRLSNMTAPTGITGRSYFKLTLQASDISGLPNDGTDCVITMRHRSTGASTFLMGALYFFPTDPAVTFSNDVTVSDYYYQAVKEVTNWGLAKGYPNSSSFKASEDLTRQRAITIFIRAAIKLGIVNMNTSTLNGTYADFENIGTAYKPYIQTYYNLLLSRGETPTSNFSATSVVNQGQICRFAEAVLSLTEPSSTERANHIGQMPIASFVSTNATLNNSMKLIYNINFVKEIQINGNNIQNVYNLWSFWNAENQDCMNCPKSIDGTKPVKGGEFANLLSNLYAYKFQKLFPNQPINGINALQTITAISDFTAIGDLFDNSNTPVGTVPTGNANGVITAQYSMTSGTTMTLQYPASSTTVFYWNMDTKGGTFISADPTHRAVTYTAPVVTQSTIVWLHSYRATNKGKIKEVWCQITVNPATAPTPTAPTIQAANLQVTGQGTNTLSLQWQRGNGQYCIVVGEEVAPHAMDAPQPNTVYSGMSNLATAPSAFSGSATKVLYTGTGTSLTVAGLDANTSYRFAVYEYNGNNATNVRYLLANPAYGTGTTNRNPVTTALFTWNANQPIAENATVSFTSSSLNYTSLQWSVSNGASILSGQGTENLNVRFSIAGTYTVTLTALNNVTGATDVMSVGVPVLSSSQIFPDLTLINPNINPQNTFTNTNINVTLNAANIGQNYNANITYVGFYFSANQTLEQGSDYYFSGSDFTISNAIARGNTSSISKNLYLPTNISGYNGANTYYILCVVDYANNITESNETNNIIAIPLYVSPAMPDITIQNVTNNNLPVPSGQNFALSVTLSNIGLATATGGWNLNAFLSKDNQLSSDDDALYLFSVDNFSITPNQTASKVYSTVKLPTTTANGNYYLIVIADNDIRVGNTSYGNNYNAEINETNNSFVLPITVANPNQPTLSASNITVNNVSTRGCSVSWSNGNGTSRMLIVRKQFVYQDYNLPYDGTQYVNANSNYAFAGEILNYSGGIPQAKLLYKGSGNNVMVSGLSPDSTYFFSVIEYNEINNTIDYLQNGALNSVIVHTLTENPNNNWKRIGLSSETFWQDLDFFDGNNGVALTDNGTAVTTNGGMTWNLSQTNTFDHKCLFMVNTQLGFAIARSGIIKTINGGLNWNKINSPADNRAMNKVKFISDQVGYVACGGIYGSSVPTGGQILKSINGGTTWSVLYTFPKPIYDVYFVNSNIGFAVAWANNVYKTMDGGVTWQESNLSTNGWQVQELFFKNSQVGFMIESNGTFYKTVDGGVTWSNTMLPLFSNNITNRITLNWRTFLQSILPYNILISNELQKKSDLIFRQKDIDMALLV